MSVPSGHHPLMSLLPKLAPVIGPGLAAHAYGLGLAVTLPDGATRPIPVTATPVILDDLELGRRTVTSRHLASATFKMAAAALGGWMRQDLLNGFSPLERELAEATSKKSTQLATVRVDYFVADKPYALEINATIPAMQGYSDIAAEAFIRAVAGKTRLGEKATQGLLDKNGSNARALFEALLLSYQAEHLGAAAPGRIALLSRRHDAQLTEQKRLAAMFTAYGIPAEVVHPDEVSFDGIHVSANGKRYDLVYRHLFIRRLEQLDQPQIKRLYGEAPTRGVSLINGPASQVEVKGVFAELSRALTEPALAQQAGLGDEELEAVRQSVPWTRRFRPGPTVLSSGEQVKDLVAHVSAHPERFVLKRSWDYGGKQVFLGNTVGEPVFDERVEAAYGGKLDWTTLCQKAATDSAGGGFVVQEIIFTETEKHLLCAGTEVREADLFVDYSGYASVGPAAQVPWGGVCRGSVSRIVNIVGGGGVIPLLRKSVADGLVEALSQS